MLGVEGLSRRFGGIYAVREVRLHVEQGELRGVLGPNGAGKSTLFHLITGHLTPDGGSVRLRGESIDRLGPAQRAEAGIAIVYQNDRIFRGMTLRENVMVGAHCRARHGFFAAALRTPRFRREERELAAIADAVLDEVGLGGLADRFADALPLGHRVDGDAEQFDPRTGPRERRGAGHVCSAPAAAPGCQTSAWRRSTRAVARRLPNSRQSRW